MRHTKKKTFLKNDHIWLKMIKPNLTNPNLPDLKVNFVIGLSFPPNMLLKPAPILLNMFWDFVLNYKNNQK